MPPLCGQHKSGKRNYLWSLLRRNLLKESKAAFHPLILLDGFNGSADSGLRNNFS